MGEKWFKEGFNNFGKERERERDVTDEEEQNNSS